MKKFSIVLICLFLAACSPDAELTFQDWDENNDGIITEAEFDEADNYLNLFEEWDQNENGDLSIEEWQTAMRASYAQKTENEYGTFNQWDIDSDGTVTDGEFAQHIFALWDTNNDATLTLEEFEEWYPEY